MKRQVVECNNVGCLVDLGQRGPVRQQYAAKGRGRIVAVVPASIYPREDTVAALLTLLACSASKKISCMRAVSFEPI
jgi:hypothetical protein